MVAREERILRPRGEENYAEVNSNEEAQVQVEVVDPNMNTCSTSNLLLYLGMST